MTSLLVAFIRDQTHKVTFNQLNLDCASTVFLCIAVNVQATTEPRSPLTQDTNTIKGVCFMTVLNQLTLLDLCHKRRRQRRKKKKDSSETRSSWNSLHSTISDIGSHVELT